MGLIIAEGFTIIYGMRKINLLRINKSTYLRRDQSDAEKETAQFLDDWDILDFSHVFCRPSIPGHIWHVLNR